MPHTYFPYFVLLHPILSLCDTSVRCGVMHWDVCAYDYALMLLLLLLRLPQAIKPFHSSLSKVPIPNVIWSAANMVTAIIAISANVIPATLVSIVRRPSVFLNAWMVAIVQPHPYALVPMAIKEHNVKEVSRVTYILIIEWRVSCNSSKSKFTPCSRDL